MSYAPATINPSTFNATFNHTEIETAVNAQAAAINAINALLKDSAATGNNDLLAAIAKLNLVVALPAADPSAPVANTVPGTSMTVSGHTYVFLVPEFIFTGIKYVATTIATNYGLGSGADYNAATALLTALIAASSFSTDGKSGVLHKTS